MATADIPTESEINEAIERGVGRLLATMEDEDEGPSPVGAARSSLSVSLRPGTQALVLYTLLKCGVPRDRPAVQLLVTNLSFQRVRDTYTAGCLLLALEAYDPVGQRAWMEELAARLVSWQTDRGLAYPAGSPDLSNTQYAALGLWAASRAGVEIDSAVWSRLTDAVLEYQSAGGGFSYHPTPTPGTGSMTAAGVGTLALCEAQLRLGGTSDAEQLELVSKARAKGLQWLESKFSVDSNPNSGAWLFYYLYGLERAGAWCGTDRIGKHDWYREGAGELLHRQHADGSWSNLFDPAQSCFALLFLRRATEGGRRVPQTGGGKRPAGFDSRARVRLKVVGTGPIELSLDGFSGPVRRDLEWSGERGRGLHIERVEYFLDGERVAVLLGDGRQPAGLRSFRVRVCPDVRGKHDVSAMVHAVTRGDGKVVLVSPSMEVDVDRARSRWTLQPADMPIDLSRAKLSVSSIWKGDECFPGVHFRGDKAVDGNHRYPWLADSEDSTPVLKLSLDRSAKADRLVITPAFFVGYESQALVRPLRVEVTVNGKREFQLFMPPQAGQAAVLRFGEALRVKRLELRLFPQKVSSFFPAVGLGEVELRLGG